MSLAGDYQTAVRMAAKREAIPLPELTGRTVLDVGCDHGYWCKLASDMGAARVVGLDRGRGVRGAGFVDLPSRNRAQGWDRCEFEQADIGKEWPAFGTFDVVFAFSIYHHLFGNCGDHAAIWAWLARHTGELLLWEGPVDTRDPIARSRARPHAMPYTRPALLAAAEEHFHVELVGPAIHRAHREVWRCRPRLLGGGPGESGVHGDEDARGRAAVRVEAAPGDAEPAGAGPGGDGGGARPAGGADGAREQDRPAAVVAGRDRAHRRARARADRAGREEPDELSGAGGADAPALAGDPGRRPGERLALILGGGACVWADVRELEELVGGPWPGLVIAANDIGSHWPGRLDHWITLHPEKLKAWTTEREKRGHPGGFVTWSKHQRNGGKQKTDRVVRTAWNGGSSGLLAVEAAYGMGVERIVLCGVPMQRTPHFAESLVHVPTKAWSSADSHWRSWERLKAKLQERTRSMSGRTMDALGRPTMEWLGLTEQEAA